jgi:chromosome segregation ATPase
MNESSTQSHEVSETLRALTRDLRTTPVRLNVFVPALQKAADHIDALTAENERLRGMVAPCEACDSLQAQNDALALRHREEVATLERREASRMNRIDELEAEAEALRALLRQMLEAADNECPNHECRMPCHVIDKAHALLNATKGE